MDPSPQYLTPRQRVKISLLALGFFIAFVYVFTAICAAGIFGDVFKTPWNGTGWVVVDYWGFAIRSATTGEVLEHKGRLLYLGLLVPLSIFWLYIFVQSLRGRKTPIVAAILNRMDSEKGKGFKFHTSVVDLQKDGDQHSVLV